MAMSSIFWNTNGTGDGASTYTSAQLVEWLRSTFLADPAAQGVLSGVGSSFAVTGTATPLTVGSGMAYVYGFPCWDNSAASVTVPTPVVGTTGHRVVLRATWSTQQVRVALKSSTDGIATPPALTQTAGTTWEVSLATLTVTTGGVITVTDTRQFAHFNTKVSAGMLDAGAALSNLGFTPWYSGNDGDGSGLDADKVAGVDIAPIRRQGGDATNWSSVGTTNYAPPTQITQCGAVNTNSGPATVTFPVAFSAPPVVVATVAAQTNAFVQVHTVTATQASFRVMLNSGSLPSGIVPITWIAIGPA